MSSLATVPFRRLAGTNSGVEEKNSSLRSESRYSAPAAMLKKITLKNYMSHAHTVIEPAAPGLTVLIGPNNCGKSAVVSALQTLCGNEKKGPYMVRHDAKDCRVILETDDGHVIEWFRTKDVPGYVVDGEPVYRVKADLLDEIQEVLRLPRVVPSEASDAAERRESFDIHFATQKAPIFLLNDPPGRAAMFFASASDAALLVEMQKKHRLKIQKAKDSKLHLEGQLKVCDSTLAALEPIGELVEAQTAIESEYAAVQAAEQERIALHGFIKQLTEQQTEHEHCYAFCRSLATLAEPPELTDISGLTSVLEALTQSLGARERWGAQAQALQATSAPPAMADVTGLAWLCEQLAEHERALEVNASRAVRLMPLAAPPELADAAELAQLVTDIDAAQQRLAVHAHTSETLRTAVAFPDPLETADLEQLVDAWTLLEEQLASTRSEAQALQSEQQAVKDQIRAWAARNPTCPTCGGVIGSETILLNQGHTHAE